MGFGLAVLIRPCDLARDVVALRECLIEQQDFHRALEPSWPEGPAIVGAYVAYLEHACATHDGRILLADLDGDVAGFVCVASALRTGEPSDPATFAWVYELYVRAVYRRRGIATALMAEAEAFARGRGAKELRLGMLDRNVDAFSLYRARGFRAYTRVLTKPL